MATKSKATKKVTVKKQPEVVKPNVANQPPAGATQEDITPVVVAEQEQSFDERTSGVNKPWLNEDGTQNVG